MLEPLNGSKPLDKQEPLIVTLYAFKPFYVLVPLMPAKERVCCDFEGLPLKVMEPLIVSAGQLMYCDSKDQP